MNGSQVGEASTTNIESCEGNDIQFFFDEITYELDDVGTHIYKVNEITGSLDSVTYSTEVCTVEVTVTDNGTGGLTVVSSTDTTPIAFTNVYEATGSLTLTGTKTLTGRALETAQFTFVMTDEDGNETTVTNQSDGTIDFGTLTFDQDDVGEHTYTITEQDDGKPGYSYDGRSYQVVVNVADNGDGSLSVTRTVNGNAQASILFENTYQAEGELSLSATKTLNGKAPDQDHQYSFTLTDVTDPADPKELETVQNQEGSITFTTLTYTEADVDKTFQYTVTEATQSEGLLTADDTVYTVSATVIDLGNGQLSITPVIVADGGSTMVDEIAFHNQLTAPLTISKTVEDGTLNEPFTFTIHLYDADGNELTGSYAYTGDVTGQITSGGTISLGHGQQVTIEGLLTGSRYTVEEMTGVAYTTTVNGTNGSAVSGEVQEDENLLAFVNTVRTTEFSVTKEWRGGSGRIDLTLYANGVKMDPQPVCQREGDTYTYTLLPVYDDQGEVIVYSAKETYVEGYMTIYVNISPYEGKTKEIYDGGTIINRPFEEQDAEFVIRKVWDGLDENAEPPKIQLILYCNGEPTDIPTPEPTKDGRYLYYHLPDEVDGQPAVYTVMEVPVHGFDAIYESRDGQRIGYGENGGTIINKRIPDTGDRMPLAAAGAAAGTAAVALIVLLVALSRKRKQTAR